MQFQWTTEMSVGHPELDADHKHLVDIINKIYDPTRSSTSLHNLLQETLQDLIEYTDIHFAREEGLLAQCSYPDLAGHKAVHAKLRAQVVDLQDKVLADEAQVYDMSRMMEIMTFLKDWLFNHIDKHDMDYVKYIQTE